MVDLVRRFLQSAGAGTSGSKGAPELVVGAFSSLTGDLRREAAAFDREIVRIGWCEDLATLAPDREGWQVILEEVKARRRRALAAGAQALAVLAELPPAALEAMLLRGWHLVFHCYGVAAGLLFPGDAEGEALKRRELQAAYLEARHRLTAPPRGQG